MGNYSGSFAPAVGLILKCHAAGWGPGKIAQEIGHAVEKKWLPPLGNDVFRQSPTKATVKYIIDRETESQEAHSRLLALAVYHRYVKRRPVVSRPIDMGGPRDVWIETDV